MSRTAEDPRAETRRPDDQSPSAAPPATTPVGHDGARVDIAERPAHHLHGARALLAVLAPLLLTALFAVLALALPGARPVLWALTALAGLATLLLLTSLRTVQPGQTRVVQFFGRYTGTVREPGLVMVVPLSTTVSVSVRVRNFETGRLKVNDATGSPVEVAAIVVWQVADTAQSTFAVEDYDEFVEMQSESALRHVVTTHPYDAPAGPSLRGSTDVVADELAHEVAARVAVAGVEVVEVRITHLAYAPEIAQAMLQRQQASAIVAAREQIVAGAVGMVELALARLQELDVVELDEERKAAMVSNLLVVLCGDGRATPVVNTGTLYG
ncbi:SPFH domain-containing protein [Paenibacillus sp. TRM 82003]|uniref:SPFH domain-containing protein n=1 Tax=Kineococcus sp. TRM81007 TaxID=2925831 RepID=UPI001F596AC7|nr:SPFH domain-containing protein [Kineococcus sp. TRM81007]MCI2240460.1 SPFH domain-containing protein [Kineococcus sp. TRM81007]MCI3925193.1 SPFH domain-containing protein [Paenibacillus sp. TRM 82003]